jgi:hypothetical protein
MVGYFIYVARLAAFPRNATGYSTEDMATPGPSLKLVTSLPRPRDAGHLRVPSWSDFERDRPPSGEHRAPDYVVVFQPRHDASDAARLEQLLRALARLRLEIECRPGGEGRLLVFVRCPEHILKSKVRKSRSVSIHLLLSHTRVVS